MRNRGSHMPTSELRKLHGVGPKALRFLQEALEAAGPSCPGSPRVDIGFPLARWVRS